MKESSSDKLGPADSHVEDDASFRAIFGSDSGDADEEGVVEEVMVEEEEKEDLVSIKEEFQRATALPVSSTTGTGNNYRWK